MYIFYSLEVFTGSLQRSPARGSFFFVLFCFKYPQVHSLFLNCLCGESRRRSESSQTGQPGRAAAACGYRAAPAPLCPPGCSLPPGYSPRGRRGHPGLCSSGRRRRGSHHAQHSKLRRRSCSRARNASSEASAPHAAAMQSPGGLQSTQEPPASLRGKTEAAPLGLSVLTLSNEADHQPTLPLAAPKAIILIGTLDLSGTRLPS